MQSTIGDLSLDKLFDTLSQAQRKFLEDAINQQNFPGEVMGSAPMTDAYQFLMGVFSFNAGKVAQIQSRYLQQQLELWTSLWFRKPGAEAKRVTEPQKGDRRFEAPEWKEYPLFDYIKQAYLLTSDALMQAVESANLEEKTKKEMVFFTRHFIDAMSPANYALTNPEVLKLAMETKGQSFASGLKNLTEDLKKGYISLSDETAFEVGENLGNTPGAVVYDNELIQLIQYRPMTDKVREIPLLIVPSVVNKFYILDLAPESSFVRYFVSQGYTVFILSWRNISLALQHLTWDDYVGKGVIKAIDVTREITGQEKVNALGYCVGGALLACALAVLASKRKHPVASMTQLIAMLDYSDPGEIGVYLGRIFSAQRLQTVAQGGVVSGKELTRAFSSLRANDLVWSFVINNYLKGKMPYAFDLFYWNTDDSNLPGPMFSSYVRNCYVENKLIKPGAMTVCGTPVDLRKINLPTYIFAASEDHLVPWKAGYESVNQLEGEIEFVLGGGGHITGPVNPFSKNKRNYWSDGKLSQNAEEWLASARSIQGSWWPHYSAWLKGHSGKEIAARTQLGSSTYPEIEAAPGRYVKERVRG
jgi:polyhydroxyalkanoate synthase subunit PhaC